jgi:hypothetical protein
MIESESSKLRKKWPWNWKNEKLTDEVLAKIIKNLPSYAKDVAYWHPTEPDWHYWYNGLEVYCRVIRDYFVKVAKEAPDFLKPKLSEIAEEVFKLINMLMEWARQKYSLCFVTEPEHRYYTIPYSDEELSNKWDTVVHKLNLYLSFGNPDENPTETDAQKVKFGFHKK